MQTSRVNSLSEFATHCREIGYLAKNGFAFSVGDGWEDIAFEEWWTMMTADGEMVRSIVMNKLSPDFRDEYADIWYAFVHMHMGSGWEDWIQQAKTGAFN